MSRRTHDLAIIGAGAAGGTLALKMARAGWQVAVFERSEFPRRKVCGEYLSPTNLPVFDELGLRARIWGAAGPEVRRTALYCGERIVPAPMPGPSRGGRALGRESLDAILLEEAGEAGAELFQPVSISGLEPRGADGWDLHARDGRRWHAKRVVAAHGSWGRSGLFTFPRPRRARPADLFGFKAHFAGGALEDDLLPCFVFPGGYGGLVNTDGGRVSFSCCVRRERIARIRERFPDRDAGRAVIAWLLEENRGLHENLGGSELAGGVLSTGPIRPGIRRRVVDGVLRIGNAAGEAHPIIAEGISVAIQSAWLAGDALLAGDDGRRYSAEWARAFAGRIRASAAMARLAMNSLGSASVSRLLESFPAMLSFGASIGGKGKFVLHAGAAR